MFFRKRETTKNAVKNELISYMAHEMRNQLATTSLYTGLLLEGSAGKISREQKKYLGEISRGSVRLVKLTDALSHMAKTEFEEFHEKNCSADIKEIMEQMAKNGVKTHFDSEIPHVAVNPKIAGAVCEHLIRRAIRTGGGSGVLTLVLRREDKRVVAKACAASAEGEKKHGRKSRASPFDQPELADRETGIEFYISRMLLERIGGKVWVEEGEYKSAVFCAAFPRARN